MTLPGSK